MRRRYLLVLMTGAAAAVPFAALAQQNERKVRIGYLSPGKGPDTPFLDELALLGYREGRNLDVVFGVFGDDPDRLPEFATAFVRAPVEVIVARGPEAAVRAVRAASNTIPTVVIAINYDPIEGGYAASLARPGGNVTGVYFQSLELALSKWNC